MQRVMECRGIICSCDIIKHVTICPMKIDEVFAHAMVSLHCEIPDTTVISQKVMLVQLFLSGDCMHNEKLKIALLSYYSHRAEQ